MICDKVEVVLIEVLISHGEKWLKELKLNVPNISQLFHFRKSRRIHVVASAGYLDEINFCRNAMLSNAGEPLPISEAVAATLRVMDVERALSGLLQDGEDVVEDPLRATWDDGPRVVGIRAATQERRAFLITHAMHALGLAVVNFDGNHNPTRPIAMPMISMSMQPQVSFQFQPPVYDTLMVTDPGELPSVLEKLFRSHLVDVVSGPSVVDGRPAGPAIVKLSIAGPPGGSEAQDSRLAKDTKAIIRLARNECCRVCGEVKPLSVAHASLSKTLVHMAARKPERLCSLLSQCMELLPHESLELPLRPPSGPDDVSSSFWVKLRGVKGDARRVALFRMLEECVRCAKNVELMLASRDVDALSALHNVAILTRQRLDDDDEDLIASATVAGTASNMEAFQAHLNVLVPTH